MDSQIKKDLLELLDICDYGIKMYISMSSINILLLFISFYYGVVDNNILLTIYCLLPLYLLYRYADTGYKYHTAYKLIESFIEADSNDNIDILIDKLKPLIK